MPGEDEDATGVGQALDRLAVAEDGLKKEREERKALEARLAKAEASNAALQASVDASAKAEAARRQDEVDGYVRGLQAKAAPTAIAEADLGHVRTLFKHGLDAQARAMGDTLLRLAKAPVSLPEGTRTISLDAGEKQAAERGQAALFAAAGFDEDDKPRRRGPKWKG